MFCWKCGESIADGSEFCWKCGTAQQAGSSGKASPAERKSNKKGGRLVPSTPAGKALLIIVVIAVVAGVTLGALYLFTSGGNESIDTPILRVWKQLEGVVEYDDANLAVTDLSPAALAEAQEELREVDSRIKQLEKDLAVHNPTNETSMEAYRKLAATLGFYGQYTAKTLEICDTVAAGQLLDPDVISRLNIMLEEMQAAASKAKKSGDDFVRYYSSIYDTD